MKGQMLKCANPDDKVITAKGISGATPASTTMTPYLANAAWTAPSALACPEWTRIQRATGSSAKPM